MGESPRKGEWKIEVKITDDFPKAHIYIDGKKIDGVVKYTVKLKCR